MTNHKEIIQRKVTLFFNSTVSTCWRKITYLKSNWLLSNCFKVCCLLQYRVCQSNAVTMNSSCLRGDINQNLKIISRDKMDELWSASKNTQLSDLPQLFDISCPIEYGMSQFLSPCLCTVSFLLWITHSCGTARNCVQQVHRTQMRRIAATDIAVILSVISKPYTRTSTFMRRTSNHERHHLPALNADF